MSNISTDKLTPHPSNNLYFEDLSGEDWEAFLTDIQEHGIRDPLRITTDFQVICGHQRLRAAIELGMQSVPVIVEDIQSVEEVERLLVEDNLHRRHLTPIQKAKLAATLKERWGIKRGGNQKAKDQNELSKVAETIGESVSTTKRLLKLNDLIPELKALVSTDKLGTVAAEQLAYLTPEEQSALYQAFGEEIGKQSVAETKEIRRQMEAERKQREELERKLSNLNSITQRKDSEIERLKNQLKELEQVEPKVVEVIPEEIQNELNELRWELSQQRVETIEVEVIPDEIQEEIEQLKQQLAKKEQEALETRQQAERYIEEAKQVPMLNDAIRELKRKEQHLEREKRAKEFEEKGEMNENKEKLLDIARKFSTRSIQYISDTSELVTLANKIVEFAPLEATSFLKTIDMMMNHLTSIRIAVGQAKEGKHSNSILIEGEIIDVQ